MDVGVFRCFSGWIGGIRLKGGLGFDDYNGCGDEAARAGGARRGSRDEQRFGEVTAMADFLPKGDEKLLNFSSNFRARIVAAPGDFGLDPQDAAQYSVRHEAYAAAFRAARAPDTRGPARTLAKKIARAALKEEARKLARIVKATPWVTAEQRFGLGLGERGGRVRAVRRPAGAPSVLILSAEGRTVTGKLLDMESGRRGRPRGVIGAAIFAHVGKNPPAKLSDWMFKGLTTKRRFRVRFATDTPPGSQVWVAACWLNPRLQRGPLSHPRCTNIPGGHDGVLEGMGLAA